MCEPCPANTQGLASGDSVCPCMPGFYRAPDDLPTGNCSGLPSAPQDLLATTTQLSAGRLLLSWSPPLDTGGRGDLTYSVECRRCEGAAACQPCGEKVRFEPAAAGLSDTRVSVSRLDAHLNYTFTVHAHNGVSQTASRASPRAFPPRPATASLTTTLRYSDPPTVTSMRVDERMPTSLSLSWVLVKKRPHSGGVSLVIRRDGNAGSFVKVTLEVRNSHSRQGPEDAYFASSEQLKPLKTYVDPHTYEDPNTAVLKFASEIHPNHISKHKVIGA
ncbi:hypothetical protein CRUP_029574, partial [Coryphaenoides rupestris]